MAPTVEALEVRPSYVLLCIGAERVYYSGPRDLRRVHWKAKAAGCGNIDGLADWLDGLMAGAQAARARDDGP